MRKYHPSRVMFHYYSLFRGCWFAGMPKWSACECWRHLNIQYHISCNIFWDGPHMSTHTAPKQSLHTTWKVDGKTPERLTRKIYWAHNHIIQQITRWCSNIQSKYRWGLQVAKSIHHPIALLVTKRFWDHHWSRGPKRKLLIVLDYFLHFSWGLSHPTVDPWC